MRICKIKSSIKEIQHAPKITYLRAQLDNDKKDYLTTENIKKQRTKQTNWITDKLGNTRKNKQSQIFIYFYTAKAD